MNLSHNIKIAHGKLPSIQTYSNRSLMTLRAVNPPAKDITELSSMHKEVITILESKKSDTEKVESVISTIRKSKAFQIQSRYESVLPTQMQQNESKLFLDFLNAFLEDGYREPFFTRNGDPDLHIESLFLTSLGLKAACYTEHNNKEVEIINGHPEFGLHVFSFEDEESYIVYNPKALARVISNNRDIFDDICINPASSSNELCLCIDNYLREHPLSMYGSFHNYDSIKSLYTENVKLGLILSIPKADCVKFSALYHLLSSKIGRCRSKSCEVKSPTEFKKHVSSMKDELSHLENTYIKNILCTLNKVVISKDYYYYRFGYNPASLFQHSRLKKALKSFKKIYLK